MIYSMSTDHDNNPICVQHASQVTDYSSQYGGLNSISYVAMNLAGEKSIYPSYGDFTQACVLRTYGPWWHQSPSAQTRFTRTPECFISEDYIELNFEKEVYPTKIEVYEIYNPGTVVRILAFDSSLYERTENVRWFLLWSGKNEKQPAASRIFSPFINKCPFSTNVIRLEFNSRLCDYYTELDAVYLYGTIKPVAQDHSLKCTCPLEGTSVDGPRITMKQANLDIETTRQRIAQICLNDNNCDTEVGNGYFDILPVFLNELTFDHYHDYWETTYKDFLQHFIDTHILHSQGEVIQEIISYLDVISLSRAAQSCHLLYGHCYDPLQYTELNLQPYWTQMNDKSLDSLLSRCQHLQKLNLSWCGGYQQITCSGFNRFLDVCYADLTCVYLASCAFIDNDVISHIGNSCANLKELNLQGCRGIDSAGFVQISKLHKLQRLNLYRTLVDLHSLVTIVRHCPDLLHLNLGSCTALNNYDDIGIELGKNCRKLKSLDIWHAKTFSHIGLHAVANGCHDLQELDVGWCRDLRSGTGCIVDLVGKCTKLRKLYLTANRTVCDEDLKAIAKNLPNLEQLDILGTRDVTREMVVHVLESCDRLKMFDVSFCNAIDFPMLRYLSRKYPNVDIKKSFQH